MLPNKNQQECKQRSRLFPSALRAFGVRLFMSLASGMPLISRVRGLLNWPFAMILSMCGAPVFFCWHCGRCQSPLKKNRRTKGKAATVE